MKTNNQEQLSFKGEHPFFIFIIPVVILLYLLIWLAFFIKFGWIVKTILLIVLGINIRYVLKRKVTNVQFSEDNVTVIYLFGYKKEYSYKDIKVFRENKEGFLPVTIIIGNLKDKSKFYFYCPSQLRNELDTFLKEKGFKVKPQA